MRWVHAALFKVIDIAICAHEVLFISNYMTEVLGMYRPVRLSASAFGKVGEDRYHTHLALNSTLPFANMTPPLAHPYNPKWTEKQSLGGSYAPGRVFGEAVDVGPPVPILTGFINFSLSMVKVKGRMVLWLWKSVGHVVNSYMAH
jgi:hypothetical protein